MPRTIEFTRSRAQYYDPPEDFHTQEGHEYPTPKRSGLMGARVYCQKLGIPFNQRIAKECFGIDEQSQTAILKSHEPRRLHHRPDSGPDPRGRNPTITHQERTAISDYLKDDNVPSEDKSKPWQDVVANAGVELRPTLHFHGGKHMASVSEQSLRWHGKKEGLGNYFMEEEKLLTDSQATSRMDWSIEQLRLRPEGKDWIKHLFSDEFHLSYNVTNRRRIKRPAGKEWRYKDWAVQKKKSYTSKEERDKAREPDFFKQLNIFVVIGYNYRKIVPYDAGNSNGKMNETCYTQQILSAIKNDLVAGDYVLVQDGDTAHNSKVTRDYIQHNGLSVLNLPHKAPDLSIFETLANPLKRRFREERQTTYQGALAHFARVFKDYDQEIINNLYMKYPDRLIECRDRKGQMTHY